MGYVGVAINTLKVVLQDSDMWTVLTEEYLYAWTPDDWIIDV